MKKCYNCGNILGDADMFCEKCGANVGNANGNSNINFQGNNINGNSNIEYNNVKGAHDYETVKTSKGIYICNALLGVVMATMLAIAVFANMKGSSSKDYLNDDYNQLKENIEKAGISFLGDNKEKFDELTAMIKNIDSSDEEEIKDSIKSLNNVVTELKQYNSKVKEYSDKIKEYNKKIKENKLTKQCRSYKSASEKAVKKLKNTIKANDMDSLEKDFKKVVSQCNQYGDAQENYVVWKKYKDNIGQIDETASGKDISGNENINTNRNSALSALQEFENAIKSGVAQKLNTYKNELITSVKKYKNVVNNTEAKKKVIYKYKYLPSIRDNYDSYGNEFVAYDSRNYVMDVDELETWLKGKGATDREIACWFTLAINEISARYGAQFSTNSLVVYFGSKSWYQNLGDDPNKIRSVFTSAEKSNFDNFGRKRNQYCKKLGISSGAKEYSYEDFNYIANNFAY